MHDQKLFGERFGETHNELFHKIKHNPIGDLSGNEQNCSTNQRPGNGDNLLEYHQNVVRPVDASMNLPADFELNPISCLSADARLLLNE